MITGKVMIRLLYCTFIALDYLKNTFAYNSVFVPLNNLLRNIEICVEVDSQSLSGILDENYLPSRFALLLL